MDSSSEQWVAIKICCKVGKTAIETAEMVCTAYGNEALTQSNIFHLYGQFHEGCEDVQDNPRGVSSSESQTDGNIRQVWQLLQQNHHLSL